MGDNVDMAWESTEDLGAVPGSQHVWALEGTVPFREREGFYVASCESSRNLRRQVRSGVKGGGEADAAATLQIPLDRAHLGTGTEGAT